MDRAGLPVENRSLTFQLSHATEGQQAATGGTSQGSSFSSFGGSNPNPNSGSGTGADRQNGQQQSRASATLHPEATALTMRGTDQTPSAPRANGLNITA